jgi:hypothetical protein
VILLVFIICLNGRVFSLSTPKAVEKLTMSLQAELIIAAFVILHPLDQSIQHRVLILQRGKLFGFPWAAMALSYTNLNARIQESQFGAMGKRRLNQVTVTSLNNPLITCLHEVMEFAKARIQRFAFWAFVPSDGIQRKAWDIAASDNSGSHRTLTRTGVSKKDKSHFAPNTPLTLTRIRRPFAPHFPPHEGKFDLNTAGWQLSFEQETCPISHTCQMSYKIAGAPYFTWGLVPREDLFMTKR